LPRLKLAFFGGDRRLTTCAQSASEVVRAIFVIFSSSELGSLSDRLGRHPVILLGLACSLAPVLSLLLSSDLWFYYVSFSFAGLLGGQADGSLNAYVADCSREGDRSLRFSLLAGCSAIGFALGPLGGASMERYAGQEAVFRFAAASGTAAIALMLLVPESLPADRRTKPKIKASLSSLVQPMKDFARTANSRMWLYVAIQFFQGCTLEGYMTVSLFAFGQLVPSWNDNDNGILLSVVGGGRLVAQLIALPCLRRWGYSDVSLAVVSQAVATLQTGVQALLMECEASKMSIFLVIGLGGCCSWFMPVFTRLVTSGHEEEIGLVLGVFTSINSLTAVCAPILFTATFALGAIWPFVLIFALNFLTLLLITYASTYAS